LFVFDYEFIAHGSKAAERRLGLLGLFFEYAVWVGLVWIVLDCFQNVASQ
jgi:hypothetical protein